MSVRLPSQAMQEQNQDAEGFDYEEADMLFQLSREADLDAVTRLFEFLNNPAELPRMRALAARMIQHLEDNDNPYVQLYRAEAELAAGNLQQALGHYLAIEDLLPTNTFNIRAYCDRVVHGLTTISAEDNVYIQIVTESVVSFMNAYENEGRLQQRDRLFRPAPIAHVVNPEAAKPGPQLEKSSEAPSSPRQFK